MAGIAGGMMIAKLIEPGQPLLVQNFAQWRAAARSLLAQGIAPEMVEWAGRHEENYLFGGMPDMDNVAGKPVQPAPEDAMRPDPKDGILHVPRKLMDLLQTAACYRSADRWAFLYRVIWRWQQGEKEVLSAADEDGNRLHSMVKAVRREQHDMHAYVRFRERPEAMGAPRFIAWYEPAHDVLPQVSRHFAERMGHATWLIATPDATVLWDGRSLHTAGALLRGPQDIEDSAEELWLTYYRSIFNPARLNPGIMHSHIRARFWKNLPEGREVPAMVAQAAAGAQRVGQVQAVGQRHGAVIPIAAERAQPQRTAPTTLDQCRRCPLWENATQPVGGTGARTARMMLVGEQPGDQEDIAGVPFVGPAGQLLQQALAQAALERDDLYLTNAVKHFKWEPRGKRRLHKTPGQQEIHACRHWLEQELAQIRPKVVVALGSTALKALLGQSQVRITEMLGQAIRHEDRWIIPVYHPAYVLRLPDETARQQAFALMIEGLRQAQRLLQSDAEE